MRVNADVDGPLLTAGNDPRVTRVGRILRRTKLDELPQLINVLWGDMSLVGPRPEVQCYVDLYNADQRQILSLTPGITDPGSLLYPNEEAVLAKAPSPERLYVEQIMPAKIAASLEYARRASFGSDLVQVVRTIFRRY